MGKKRTGLLPVAVVGGMALIAATRSVSGGGKPPRERVSAEIVDVRVE